MKQKPTSFQSHLDRGVDHIKVELYPTLDPQAAANTIASFYLSTWDDPVPIDDWWSTQAMQDTAWRHAQNAMAGKVLPNTLESISVTFAISGISRATTHQLVRSRVGAVFGQQGGRDNNWTDFNLRVPDTWYRNDGLVQGLEDLQIQANSLYHRAIMEGVPYQDARYALPMGLETALVASYNLLSFKGLAERRLCNRMMWETNYVVRRMSDALLEAFPFIGRSLRSGCEKRGVCGSVSPMFPPSCYSMDRTSKMARPVPDNPTLEHDTKENGYDWPRDANSAWVLFGNQDAQRIEGEYYQETHARSLLGHQLTLARKDDQGLWRANHNA